MQSPRTLRQQAATEDGILDINAFNIDTSNRLANLIDFHKHYPVDGNDTDLIDWSGDVASCDEGTIGPNYQDLVLRRINYFRGRAGLSTTISFDTAKNAAAQQAALVTVRQKNLSQTPLWDWPTNPCVTAASEVTASAANLALGSFGLNSIDRLMLNDGSNNGPVGHRRWFLKQWKWDMARFRSCPATHPHASSRSLATLAGCRLLNLSTGQMKATAPTRSSLIETLITPVGRSPTLKLISAQQKSQ